MNLNEDATFNRVKAFLEGWDAATDCWLETMSWVPDDQLVAVIRHKQQARGIEVRG